MDKTCWIRLFLIALHVLPKTNKYDEGCYILLSGLVFFNKAINLSKNQTNDLPFAL